VNIARTIGRIAAVLAMVGALTALAGVAQAQLSAPPGMTPGEYQALMLRSEALNQEYGLGEYAADAVTSRPIDSTQDFAWGAFGIGAVAMLGLALLAGGVVVRHQTLGARRGPTPSGTT
jgi:hypothetical protein